MNRILSWVIVPFILVSSLSMFGQVGGYSFAATSGTFTAINGSDTVSDIHADSKLSTANIPIGFTFNYDGTNYTKLKASSNGFLQLDTTKTSSRTTNDLDNVNEPILAPLWDDHDGRATGGSVASYVVTGVSPNRVFTFEWLNWEWNYASSNPVISFQVKLYETSNKIEYVYRPESGSVNNGSASIGVCGLGTGSGTFLSLNNFGTSPTASSTSETTTINAKPASGQIYTFSPPTCLSAPTAIWDSAATATSSTIKFASTGTSFEYTYGVKGSSTTNTAYTTSKSFGLSSLTAATDYTVSIRSICSPGDTSAGVAYDFTTAYASPQEVNFTGFTGSNLSTVFPGWNESAGNPKPLGTTSNWTNSASAQTTAFGKTSAKINLYTTSRKEWLISPRIIATGTDSLRYKVAVTNYTTAGTDAMGADDSVKVMISNNGGYTWNMVKVFTAASSLSNSLTAYSMSLGAYAGQTIQVAFYAQDGPIDNSEDYDFHVADIFMGTPPNIDMKANNAYVMPGCLTASQMIYAVIENNTSTTINFASNNTTVGAKVTGPITKTITTSLTSDTLAGGDTMHVFIDTVNLSAAGTYSVKPFVMVTGDGNSGNDSGSVLALVQDPTAAIPQKVNFAGFTGSNLSTVFPGWREAANKPLPTGTSSSWTIGNAAQQTHFGTTTAKVNLYTTSRDEWIISPKMSVTATDTIVFKAGITDYNNASSGTMGSDDSVIVYVSNNCGNSWNQVMVFTSANEPGNTLSTYKVSLGAYSGSDVYVAFYAQDGPIDNSEDYDFHITDIFIGTPPANDVGVTAFIGSTSFCGDDSTEVKVVVHNFGSATQSSVGVTVDISGTASTSVSSTIVSLASGASDTIVVGTLNTLAGGTFNLTGYTTHSGDQDNTNDTTKLSGVKVGAIPTAPTASSATVCAGSDTVLVASGGTAGYRWYGSAKPDSVIHTGDSLKLTGVSSTETYMVEGYNFSSQTFGPTTAPTGSFISTNAGRGTGFNVNVS